MEQLTVKFKGTQPLLMHNNRSANPLSVYAQTLKPLTSKRNKTDADFREIARMEWESGLYLESNGNGQQVVVMPAKCIMRSTWEGAKKSKNGKLFQTGVLCTSDYFPLEYEGLRITVPTPRDADLFPDVNLNKFYEEHKHQVPVKVGQSYVLRTRPIFINWSVVVTYDFQDSIIDRRTLAGCVEAAGAYAGLCDWRPYFGRFEVE